MSKAIAAIARAKSEQLLKESSDVDASISSHDSDDEMINYGNGRVKKEPDEVFDENGTANGVEYPAADRDLSLNGNHKEFPRDGLSEQLLFAKGLIPGYQTYSVDQKQEVVNYAKETTVREAARKYSVPRSTVQVWCKHGHSKREKRSPGERGGGGGRRLSYSNETDEKLYHWVMKQQENGTPVTRDAIQLQARTLIRDECPDFKASSGWVEKFLTRHNLCIQTRMSSNNPLEAVPICYVIPQSQVTFPSPGTPSNNANSPRADGRSVTSEDTRSDSGDDDDMDEATSAALATMPVGQSVIREPPNLQEILKPIQNLDSPAVGVKDEDDEDGDGEEGDGEKTEINVNPERLKAFNMFVRLFVDENLDRLVPISKQPKDKILAIIQSCQRQFPEFRDRARKRIRTYLKSCRRLKKLREPLKRTADQMSTNPNMSAAQMAQVNNILASACASEVENKRSCTDPDNLAAPFSSVAATPSPTASMMTHSPAVPAPVCTPEKALEGTTIHKPKVLTQNQLNPSEITAIRQLIAGYRESAAFLYRSADELEALIPQNVQGV